MLSNEKIDCDRKSNRTTSVYRPRSRRSVDESTPGDRLQSGDFLTNVKMETSLLTVTDQQPARRVQTLFQPHDQQVQTRRSALFGKLKGKTIFARSFNETSFLIKHFPNQI